MQGYFDGYFDFKSAEGVFATSNRSDKIQALTTGIGSHGIEFNASKPNMQGYFDGYFDFKSAEGVFATSNRSDKIQALTTGIGSHGIEFNASKVNAIFGASSTVQPAGLYVQSLIRYA